MQLRAYMPHSGKHITSSVGRTGCCLNVVSIASSHSSCLRAIHSRSFSLFLFVVSHTGQKTVCLQLCSHTRTQHLSLIKNTETKMMTTTTTITATAKMKSLTLTVPLPSHQHAPSSKRLLGLPLELRNLIYYHVLVDMPKYSRTHHQDCHFRQNHTRNSIEPAACHVLELAVNLVPSQAPYPWDVLLQCRCAKRTTLNLLLACRQLHREAAPVFWSANTFVFDHPDEFAICVGARLREAYRPLLRHVYIASPDGWDTSPRTQANIFTNARIAQKGGMPRWLQFWGVLKQCRGMRTLAVRPEVVRRHAADMAALREWMPELRRLELTWVGKYKDHTVNWERDWGSFRACTTLQRHTVFARATQVVDLRGGGAGAGFSKERCKNLYRDFTTNFCVYVDSIVRERFLGCDPEQDRDWIVLHDGRVAAGLDDARTSYRVALPTGQKTRVTFMAAPQSQRTRVRLTRARLARDAELKARGRPTAAEEQVLRQIEGRRAANKSREADEEACEREKTLSARRAREEERRREERRERERERAELERAVEAAREKRRTERKRVARRRSVEGETGEDSE
ncbi:hypothetical protein CTA2_9633 [Colletotrichum tanaceti]|uniref:DUF7730 domain-containing protein n=1 Tax=Colletotrichum tanaceti TaxID=1306861 RepID=A0A4U6XDG5_9PEZI|nr:hypothetical protein CTA2_9633 [Colletotrichum tanaceti]TKW53239.1 hypothetical protein CTA1_6089 [Colletotrichum tanaceti]